MMTDPVKAAQRKKLFAFGAVVVVICLLVSFLSGAAGSYLVLSLYPLTKIGKTEPSSENVFVPEFSETQTAAETTTEQEPTDETTAETTAGPEQTEPTTQEIPVTQPVTEAPLPPTTEAPPAPKKTKGEIYAQAVNSIVGVEALSQERYTGLFGRTFTQKYASSGSGFFITADGYIVTNYHVIEGAYEVSVTTYDGTEYPAEIKGYEKANDVAVLKVSGEFTPVDLGDSSALTVGDDVLVIGNALGELSYTFTDGVVSYLSRAVTTESGAVINMFQTNAAINQGNSGGPVYNMDGEVVGIASAKYASETVEGLGFCIPVNDVMTIVDDIVRYGYVTGKPLLGVSVQTVSASMAYSYNIPTGCYIVAVGSGTAADTAGLRQGCVITHLNGTRVNTCDDLTAILSTVKAGDSVTVTASGENGSFTVNVTLGEYVPAEPRTDYSNVRDV